MTGDEASRLLQRLARAAAARVAPAELARGVLEALCGPLRADGASVYAVEGSELVLLAFQGSAPPPARLPLPGTFNGVLLAAPGARSWLLGEAPERVRDVLAGPPQTVIASAAIPSGSLRLGLIHVARTTGGHFSDEELQLLGAAAALVGPSFELGGREAGGPLGRELSVLHRIAAAAGRRLELPVVVRSCIELARELTGADYAALYLVDEHRQRLSLAGGEALETGEAGPELSSLPLGAIAHLGRSPHPVLRAAEDSSEPYRSALGKAGIRLTVSLPLMAGDTLVGLLALAFRGERTFAASTLDTLVAMAEQQAVAIDCARSQQLAELRALLSAVVREAAERALAASTDTQTYDALLEGACLLCRSGAARLTLVEKDGALRTARARGLPPALAAIEVVRPTATMRAALEAARGPTFANDGAALAFDSPWVEAFRASGMSALVAIPLRLHERILGLITVPMAAPHRFHPEEKAAMALLASVASSAIEARRQRRAAEEERARLGQILEHLPLPVVVLDVAGRFEHVNAAYRELNPAAHIGQSWFEATVALGVKTPSGTDTRVGELPAARALRGEPAPPTDFRVRGAGGRWRHLVTQAAALHTEAGVLAGVVAAVQDVTALRDLADAKDRFIDIASHELRSPLAALRACTSMLEMDPAALADPERRRHLTTRILLQVDRMVAHVDEMTEMARIRGGGLKLHCSRFDLVEAAREVAEVAQLEAQQHRIAVHAEGPVTGLWDRQRITQVVTNLVSNAARYSPGGGEIAVHVGRRGELAALSVEDHGIGISAEDQARLFEPYYRGQAAGKVAHHGLGLGLHISMEIVRHHQGAIEVESQLGQGSRFTVLLPREPPP